ncbi:MAG: hypothetical protein MJE68_08455 [Proteobacteria bacterium]|nr:hypothetical protein [Pseudomonadota bacterium]
MRLEEEGFLIYIDKDRMEADNVFPKSRCFSAILKKDMRDLDKEFFKLAKDEECTDELYETNYNKDIEKVMKQVAAIYVEDFRKVNFMLPSGISESKYLVSFIR